MDGLFVVYLLIAVLAIVGMWKVFTKAGEEGWKSIIPIYNLLVLLKIAGRPLWWVVLMIIPCVGIVVFVIVGIDLARSFGKADGFGWGLGLLPMIFYPILGFGPDAYQGPAGPEKNVSI